MQEITELKKQIELLEKTKKELDSRETVTPFSMHQIKHSNKLVKQYTGIISYDVFLWLFKKLKTKASKLQYNRGKHSQREKFHQEELHRCKPGPQSKLDDEEKFFMTLVRLKQGCPEEDLAWRFQISISVCSCILTTWIPFLSKELDNLIYWPERSKINQYYPKCFQPFKHVGAILDCTEVRLGKSFLAQAQSQTYSKCENIDNFQLFICLYTSWNTMPCVKSLWW